MNRITDVILTTQMSCCVAAVLTYLAHLIENGSILNANWHWAIYPLLGCGCLFMLIPHLISHEKEQS